MTDLTALKKYSLCYLATPYSKYKWGIEMAFIDAAVVAGTFVVHGVPVYSPIVSTHPVAIYNRMDPYNSKFWVTVDKAIMNFCDAIVVANLVGWEESEGVLLERKYFAKYDKPAYLFDVETHEVTTLDPPNQKATHGEKAEEKVRA